MSASTRSEVAGRAPVNGTPGPTAGPSLGGGGSRGRQLPTTPRRYGQWAATLLFLVLCVVAAGWLWQHQGDQVEVLVVRTAVPAGATLDRADLGAASVSGVAGAIPVAETDRVLGRTAATGLVPGQVLIEGLVSDHPVPAASERVVGLLLDPTRVPDGLVPGDVVTVVAVPPPGDAGGSGQLTRPTVLTEAATVHLVAGTQDGGTRLSLLVEDETATQVTAFGAAGRVAVLQAPAPGAGEDSASSDGAGREQAGG